MPLLKAPSAYPELFTRSVNTKSSDWCLSGTKARIPMTMAAPATCHQTETLLMTAIK